MKDLFGGSASTPTDPGDPLPLQAGPTGPWSFDGSSRRIWITWRYNVAGSFILPINLYNYVDMSGTDESKWRILRIVYHNQAFTSPDAFLEAYNNGRLIRFPRPSLEPEAWDWASRIRPYGLDTTSEASAAPSATGGVRDASGKKGKHSKGKHDNRRIQAPTRDLDDLPGPRQGSFAGKRFRVHEQQRRITWMGWSFYTGFDRDMGVNLWGRLSARTPRSHSPIYRAPPPGWTDSLAVFLGAETWHANLGGKSGHLRRDHAVCIFEHDTGKPLTRHTGDNLNEMGATKGHVLVVSVTTTTYSTTPSNSTERSKSDSLPQGTSRANTRWRVNATMDIGFESLASGVCMIMVDLDVAGTNNSVLKTSMKEQEIKIPFFSSEDEEGFDDWGNTVTQQVITGSYLKTEEESRVDYIVHPGMSPVRNTVGSKRLLNNANWAKYNLAVTRMEDNELASFCQWNLQLGGALAVNFENFFNNESILQYDLVIWVPRLHHLPQAEDLPNTKTSMMREHPLDVPEGGRYSTASGQTDDTIGAIVVLEPPVVLLNRVLPPSDSSWRVTNEVPKGKLGGWGDDSRAPARRRFLVLWVPDMWQRRYGYESSQGRRLIGKHLTSPTRPDAELKPVKRKSILSKQLSQIQWVHDATDAINSAIHSG
ncbi:copper amine oxidase [Coprinopsis sp. MPI-PUGE-AT-0042]|nr:copper amine oxidase [Coprinopsis sp. MPI-PUGE-AT-0042]